jgi:hypothetical protein
VEREGQVWPLPRPRSGMMGELATPRTDAHSLAVWQPRAQTLHPDSLRSKGTTFHYIILERLFSLLRARHFSAECQRSLRRRGRGWVRRCGGSQRHPQNLVQRLCHSNVLQRPWSGSLPLQVSRLPLPYHLAGAHWFFHRLGYITPPTSSAVVFRHKPFGGLRSGPFLDWMISCHPQSQPTSQVCRPLCNEIRLLG